jgi:hypothetical protein
MAFEDRAIGEGPAEKTGIHVKTLHQMFDPKGNPTAANLFNIIACLQEHEGARLQVVA